MFCTGNGGSTTTINVSSNFVPPSQHPGPPPKSPARTIVRAHLGDHGHTFVPTKPGITVRDALSKAMKLRKLVPETCAVYRCSDPSKVSQGHRRNWLLYFWGQNFILGQTLVTILQH